MGYETVPRQDDLGRWWFIFKDFQGLVIGYYGPVWPEDTPLHLNT